MGKKSKAKVVSRKNTVEQKCDLVEENTFILKRNFQAHIQKAL